MLRVNDYEIRWYHRQHHDTSKKMDSSMAESPVNRGVTVCFIRRTHESLQRDYHGMAICIKGDNFSYDEGRRRSLKRAFGDSTIPKEERREIWEAYRHMTTIPRW